MLPDLFSGHSHGQCCSRAGDLRVMILAATNRHAQTRFNERDRPLDTGASVEAVSWSKRWAACPGRSPSLPLYTAVASGAPKNLPARSPSVRWWGLQQN